LAERGGAAACLQGGSAVWRDARVALRDREGRHDRASGLPGVRRKDRALGVGVQRLRVKGGGRERVPEVLPCQACPAGTVGVTREGWWSGGRGRGRADVVAGHWGLPSG
jgi:hypothetical protein